MIKFYQGLWSEVSGKVDSANNIVFVTDRQVLMMGGKQYGKSQETLVTSGVTKSNVTYYQGALVSTYTDTLNVAPCTLFYLSGDQTILRYMGTGLAGTNWEVVQSPRLSAAAFISNATDASNGTIVYTTSASSDQYFATANDVKTAAEDIEAKISAAYHTSATSGTSVGKKHNGTDTAAITSGANNIIVSDANGIVRTDYGLDTGNVIDQILDTTQAADAKSNDLDQTLVNARTLAKVYEDVKSQAVTIATSDPDGLITWASAGDFGGTTWTPSFGYLAAASGNTDTSAGFKNNGGQLENHIAIRKIDTNEGYLATYALFNENAGTGDAAIKLGDDINLVKDQFLKTAGYVRGKTIQGVTFEYLPAGNVDGTAYTSGYYKNGIYTSTAADKLSGDDIPSSENSANRYLKLVFALTRSNDKGASEGDNNDEGQPSGQINNNTSSDADSIIYIDVNELFDSYTAYNGVAIDDGTNEIYGVVNSGTEKTIENGSLSTSAAGVNGRSATAAKAVRSGTHVDNAAYLTVGANGFSVDGINQEITAYIEDLNNDLVAPDNTFMTQVGVSDGLLTAAYLSSYASGVNFDDIVAAPGKDANARVAVVGTTVQDAFNSVSNTIAKLDMEYEGTGAGDNGMTKYVCYVAQDDGLVTVSGHVIEATDLSVHSETSPALTASIWNGTQYADEVKPVPVYAITSANETGTGSIQDALNDIVNSTAATFASLDMAVKGTIPGNTQMRDNNTSVQPSAATTGTGTYTEDATNGRVYDGNYEPYKIINTIKQQDGFVSATDLLLVAQTVGFVPLTANAAEGAGLNNGTGARAAGAGAYIPVSGYTVGAALSSISNYIGSLDYDSTTDTNTFADTTGAKIVNNVTYVIDRVTQDQGQLSAHYTSLDATNFYFPGITAKLTGDTDEVRVGIAAGTIFSAIDTISNLIADYGSFHKVTGAGTASEKEQVING